MSQTLPDMRLGFAGLGRMGFRMAANCVRAGFSVTVWNRSPARVDAFIHEHVVEVAETPAELAEACDVVVTMLASDEAARIVYLGEHGLIGASRAKTLVEMGTMSPALVGELATCAEIVDQLFVDAPVSGATAAAADAQLLIMVGAGECENPNLDPVFSAMGRKTIWLGASGKALAVSV